MIKYVDMLEFDEQPDYQYCIQQLINEIKLSGERLDWVMDWSKSENPNWIKSFKQNKERFDKFVKVNKNLQKTYSTFMDSSYLGKIQTLKGMSHQESQQDITITIEKSQSQLSNLSPLFPFGRFGSMRKNTLGCQEEAHSSANLNKVSSVLSGGKFPQNNIPMVATGSGNLQYINSALKQQLKKHNTSLLQIPESHAGGDDFSKRVKPWSPFNVNNKIQEEQEDESESYSCGDFNQEALKIPFPQKHKEYESPKKVILQPIHLLNNRLHSKRKSINKYQRSQSLFQKAVSQVQSEQSKLNRDTSVEQQRLQILQQKYSKNQRLENNRKNENQQLKNEESNQQQKDVQKLRKRDESEFRETEIDEINDIVNLDSCLLHNLDPKDIQLQIPNSHNVSKQQNQIEKQLKMTGDWLIKKHLGIDSLISSEFHTNDLKVINKQNSNGNEVLVKQSQQPRPSKIVSATNLTNEYNLNHQNNSTIKQQQNLVQRRIFIDLPNKSTYDQKNKSCIIKI